MSAVEKKVPDLSKALDFRIFKLPTFPVIPASPSLSYVALDSSGSWKLISRYREEHDVESQTFLLEKIKELEQRLKKLEEELTLELLQGMEL